MSNLRHIDNTDLVMLRRLTLQHAYDKDNIDKKKALDKHIESIGVKYNFDPQVAGVSLVDGLIISEVPKEVRDMKGEIDK